MGKNGPKAIIKTMKEAEIIGIFYNEDGTVYEEKEYSLV